MKYISHLIFPAFLFLLFETNAQNPNDKISLIQKNLIIEIQDISDVVHLKKEAFSIRFKQNLTPVESEDLFICQVAVLDNPEDTAQIMKGVLVDNIEYFSPGTGMATGSSYDYLFVSNTGHHYLFYEDNKHKRLTIIGQQGNQYEFEWKIKGLYDFEIEKDIPFSKMNVQELYFVIFINKNRNQTVDEGEYTIVKAIFE